MGPLSLQIFVRKEKVFLIDLLAIGYHIVQALEVVKRNGSRYFFVMKLEVRRDRAKAKYSVIEYCRDVKIYNINIDLKIMG